jgi:hypothetical protein
MAALREADMQGVRRFLAGIRRILIVLAVILALPAFYAFFTWLFLGQMPPTKAYVFLAAGLGAYVFASSIGWIIVGFKGGDEAR